MLFLRAKKKNTNKVRIQLFCFAYQFRWSISRCQLEGTGYFESVCPLDENNPSIVMMFVAYIHQDSVLIKQTINRNTPVVRVGRIRDS